MSKDYKHLTSSSEGHGLSHHAPFDAHTPGQAKRTAIRHIQADTRYLTFRTAPSTTTVVVEREEGLHHVFDSGSVWLMPVCSADKLTSARRALERVVAATGCG